MSWSPLSRRAWRGLAALALAVLLGVPALPAAASPPSEANPGGVIPAEVSGALAGAWRKAWDLVPPARPALLLPVAVKVAVGRLLEAPLAGYVAILERLRGLDFAHPVPWSVKKKEQVRRFLEEVLDRDYPRERSDFDQAALLRLGLVSPPFEIRGFMVDLLGDQVQGAYDPEVGTFFVVPQKAHWLERVLTAGGPSSDDLVAVHELDHALQDQVFDLKALQKAAMKRRSSDREMALQALVEGDATLVMFEHVFQTQGRGLEQVGDLSALAALVEFMPGMGGLGGAPLYFRRSLMFPYFTGADLVLTVHRVGGWDLVNRMYEDPPLSTEQVLHPESYLFDRDDPLDVRLDGLPETLGDWTAMGEDTGGEFLVRVFLEQKGAPDPERAASGWGGDRLRLYRREDKTFLVWVTWWDDEDQARQFEDAARGALKGEGREWTVWRSGRGVTLAAGVPAGLLDQVRRGAAGTKVQPIRSPRKVVEAPFEGWP